MDALEKAELIASIRHIERYLKSGIPIYNTEVPDTAGKREEEGEEEYRQLQSVIRFS